MRRTTRHTRRSDRRIECCMCGARIRPGERYRRQVFVNDDALVELYSESFRYNTAHDDCAEGREFWTVDGEPEPLPVPRGPVAWTAERWNERYPVGTRVDYFPIAGLDDHQRTQTRSAAWDVCGHTSVKVDGVAGGVSVEHLAVLGVARG